MTALADSVRAGVPPVPAAPSLLPWDRTRLVGLDRPVPLFDGRLARCTNLDNAASTPALREVADAVERFLPSYANVHRGTGYTSRVSTAMYAEAHEIVARFVGASPATNTVIFGKNTTEAINKLAWRLPLAPGSVVLSTVMEHHSNDLPWRRATVVRARATAEGRLDEEDYERLLAMYSGRIALVTVSGASNVTGFVQPIHRLARKAHMAGAPILVDAAQLAPHRTIDVRPDDDPEHIDFVALSAHKMYAPFGTGALVGPRRVFLEGAPEYQGGGTVDVVTLDDVLWADPPDRDEAGTPNVVGAVALAVAAQVLMEEDRTGLEAHETSLTAYATAGLQAIPGVTVYGAGDGSDKVGVLAFNVDDIPHALVAAILSDEAGISVRNGCFCAQPYVAHLMGLDEQERDRARAADHASRPGMVRASLGAYNTVADIDLLLQMVQRIARHDWRGAYTRDSHGRYCPTGIADAIPGIASLRSAPR